MMTSAFGDIIQTGTVHNDYNQDAGTWNLAVGQPPGERYFLQHVDFLRPFTEKQPPIVLVMLSGIDSEESVNERVRVTSEDITNYGFTVRYATWADSSLYGADVTWIAIPQSMALYKSALVKS
ncbi:MAG: H-type lectin domain-containing protein [Methanothrix sp.]|jgi:hypothetical protein|nr:H-type lectin domain-containing protein [Methanothrix sp.]